MFLAIAMANWAPADWGVFFLAASPFVAGIGAAVAVIINAINKNTNATVENTNNRAIVASVTNAKLDTIATVQAASSSPTVTNTVNTSPSTETTPPGPSPI